MVTTITETLFGNVTFKQSTGHFLAENVCFLSDSELYNNFEIHDTSENSFFLVDEMIYNHKKDIFYNNWRKIVTVLSTAS